MRKFQTLGNQFGFRPLRDDPRRPISPASFDFGAGADDEDIWQEEVTGLAYQDCGGGCRVIRKRIAAD